MNTEIQLANLYPALRDKGKIDLATLPFTTDIKCEDAVLYFYNKILSSTDIKFKVIAALHMMKYYSLSAYALQGYSGFKYSIFMCDDTVECCRKICNDPEHLYGFLVCH